MSNRTTKILKLFFTLLIPILLITGTVRLLATDQYLAFEYSKASFPKDEYGFADRQRFILASSNIHYVLGHLPNDELSKQTLNGIPVYNPREVSHMADVREVFRWVLLIGQVAFLLLVLIGLFFWRKGERQALGLGIQTGGLLTSVIILFIGLSATFAWQAWFNIFHLLFFKPGSWLFSYSDTLIRLFPVKFWLDATLTISFLSFIGGVFFLLLGWRWQMAMTQPARMVE